MRTSRNVKASGTVFTRTVEAIEPEMACFRALPAVQHLWTRQQVLADIGSFMAATTLVSKHNGSVPIFHVRHPQAVMESCIAGVLGERISS